MKGGAVFDPTPVWDAEADAIWVLFSVRDLTGQLTKRPLGFSQVNRVCTALLCGGVGRLTAKNGVFRPGQYCPAAHMPGCGKYAVPAEPWANFEMWAVRSTDGGARRGCCSHFHAARNVAYGEPRRNYTGAHENL